MSDINVSVCISSNRPHLWEWFYNNVAMNTINFEINFVGNVAPNFTLPDRCHFTYSNTKPLQCMYIAIKLSKGELLQMNVDDCHSSPYSLDIMYNLYKSQNDYKCMIAPKFFGVIHTPNMTELQRTADETPVDPDYLYVTSGENKILGLPSGGMMSKQLFFELGGYDKRFIWAGADGDLFIRAYQFGAKIVPCKDAWSVERKDLCPNWENGKSKLYEGNRWEVFLPLWYKDSVWRPENFLGKRTSELEPFVDSDDLLTVSQGPKGEWD